MIHFWVKIYDEDKIIKSLTKAFTKFDIKNISDNINELCYELDVPTPIILNKHINGFTEYNSATFLPSEFVESVNFQKLVIEIY